MRTIVNETFRHNDKNSVKHYETAVRRKYIIGTFSQYTHSFTPFHSHTVSFRFVSFHFIFLLYNISFHLTLFHFI